MESNYTYQEVKKDDEELLGKVWKIWEEALPQHERPQSKEAVQELLKSEDYHVIAGFLDEVPVFFIAYRNLNDEYLVMEHLACKKDMRGKGLGTKFMEIFAKQFYDEKKKNILAEIERPEDYEGLNKKNAEGRIRWYKKCGYVVHYKNIHKYPHRLEKNKFMQTFLILYGRDFKSDEEFFDISKMINLKSYGFVLEI